MFVEQLELQFDEEITEATEEVVEERAEDFEQPIEVGSIVKAVEPNASDDIESYYYKETFSGKKGTVFSIHKGAKGTVCYEVEFSKQIGIFYNSDLKLLSQ